MECKLASIAVIIASSGRAASATCVMTIISLIISLIPFFRKSYSFSQSAFDVLSLRGVFNALSMNFATFVSSAPDDFKLLKKESYVKAPPDSSSIISWS